MSHINKSSSEPILKRTKAMQSQSKLSSNLSQTNSALLPLIPEPEPPSPDHNHHIGINPRADPNKWTQVEEQLFITFWVQKFVDCPYDIFSFHQPLRRNALFIELSTFLKARSLQENTSINKDSGKCKTKFQTIKRQAHRAIKNGKQSQDYDFIHYILEQSQKMTQKIPMPFLSDLVAQLRAMKEEKSQLMAVTEQLLRLELSEYESLNESILIYSENLKPKLKGKPKGD